MWLELVLSVGFILISYLSYKLSTNNARYFEERKLKYKGVSNWFHSLYTIIFGKTDILKLSQGIYDAFPDESIYGAFDFAIRQYVIRDPGAYKRIAVKDFDYFEDHRVIVDDTVNDLLGNTLVTMHGERWRQMRATLSPAFTGSKMRQMFELVSECADEVVKYFSKKAEGGQRLDMEMKDFFSRYTNDVISTCAFGLRINSFENPENEFFLNGKKIMTPGGFLQIIKFFFQLLFPKISRAINLRIFDSTITDSFKHIILDTMKTRQNNNIHRPDMINMLMKVRQGDLQDQIEEKTKETLDGFATANESDIGRATVTRKWNDNEIIAQCFLFFLAGFETSSNMLGFTAYELVANPDVQQQLYEEIAEIHEQLGDNRISYEALQKMKYLDQVVCEVLRKWPVGLQNERNCVKDYVYDDGEKKFTIEKGSNVIFPIYGIHRDPKYFPDPEKFDPERFSDENKHNIIPGTYAPFGIGPRNCIGSRFALMEIKAILYYLLLHFSFEVNEKTEIPLKMPRGSFVFFEKGIHLELKPRQHT